MFVCVYANQCLWVVVCECDDKNVWVYNVKFISLTKHKIIWSEQLPKWAGAHGIHGTGLQIHQHGPRYIFTT